METDNIFHREKTKNAPNEIKSINQKALFKYVSLLIFFLFSYWFFYDFLTDEIISSDIDYKNFLELIKKLYSEDPLKLTLSFSIFGGVLSVWGVLWRIYDKKKEFEYAEFAQNELRFSNAVNLLSKKEDPVFFSEGIRELARLKRERKINSEKIDQLTSSKVTIAEGSFSNADLNGINLAYANIDHADLKNANLENADLRNADLKNANLENANLENAYLYKANLQNANLKNANLKNTNLHNAYLNNTNLENANLENANLGYAELVGTNLENANLENAYLENAELVGINLKNANLEGTNIQGTILGNKQP